jgi:hypothetical protein
MLWGPAGVELDTMLCATADVGTRTMLGDAHRAVCTSWCQDAMCTISAYYTLAGFNCYMTPCRFAVYGAQLRGLRQAVC